MAATHTRVGGMTVRDLLMGFENHKRRIMRERDKLALEIGTKTINSKSARRKFSKAIKEFLEDYGLIVPFEIAFETLYNKNGVSIEDSNKRHALFEDFYREMRGLTGMNLKEGSVNFENLCREVRKFYLPDSYYSEVVKLLENYYQGDLDEAILSDQLLIQAMQEFETPKKGIGLPFESSARPWYSSH